MAEEAGAWAGEDSAAQTRVIDANVEFYKEIAKKYDSYEACACEEFYQLMLEEDVDAIAASLTPRFERIRCLDCGGGSGNLTIKMLRRGWEVTVVDVSPEMLALLKRKVRRLGFEARFENRSIEGFLSATTGKWELITFSSVLHHLYRPEEVVRKAAARIGVGGIFYSNFDPVRPESRMVSSCFYNLDTTLAKALHDRRDFLPGIGRRLQKLMGRAPKTLERVVAGAGDLAEYHARAGLDDAAIAGVLEQEGFRVQWTRYATGRTRLTRWLNERVRALLSFKLMAQRGR
jgi:2-polyprenyl-3-methyl-5-hydroxy-6-metoxy-1,4-benzoquinol methylase